MLKIKDNVDLKELEKFGFEYDEDYDYWFYYAFTEPNDQSEVRYYIDNKDRRISIGFDMYVNPLFRCSNTRLKESMKVLTKAYSELWEYLEKEHGDVLDEFLMREE